MPTTILIVDDEPVQRRLLESAVNKMGYRTVLAEDGDDAMAKLNPGSGRNVDLVVMDLVMPGLDGMGALERMRSEKITTPVIVQTAKGSIDAVVSAMRAGACDFFVKPVSFERLSISIANALKLGAMEDAVQKVQKSSNGEFGFEDLIANSSAMDRVIKLGKRAADSTIPVLIEGESGVGKEVIAKAIQGSGDRRGKPFVTVNCGALPENLVESILFGHEKGSFTGASGTHVGKFVEANGGTLFLDEVGELSLDIQVKLLRAIQEGEVDPIGAKRPKKTDFRLISATNRDMIEMVRQGRFREDLYYRLNVFPIGVPSLRQRKSDIASLVRYFTARLSLEQGRRNITGIRADALAMLEAFDWPGNIRQLENAVYRAIILCEDDQLKIEDFPHVEVEINGFVAEIGGHAQEVVPIGDNASGNDIDRLEDGHASPLSGAIDGTFLNLSGSDGTPRTLSELESDAIQSAITYHDGRMTKVARSLGIGRSTLYRKLKEYGLDENGKLSATEPAHVSTEQCA